MSTAPQLVEVIPPGSEPLENPKQEIFARLVGAGCTQAEGYLGAGYKAKNMDAANSLGGRMMTVDVVRTRVNFFRAKAEAKRETIVQAVVLGRIHDRVERLRGYDARRAALYALIAARAGDQANQDIAGIKTGLLVVSTITTEKKSGTVIRREVRTDGTVLRALLDLERQAAIEVGDWVEKKDIDILWDKDPKKLTPQQLDALIGHIYSKDPGAVATLAEEMGVPLMIEAQAEPAGATPQIKVDPLA